jgi:hypothetical protein
MKQLAFFINPSHLSWEIISWLSDQIFNANHLIFMGYGISTLAYQSAGKFQEASTGVLSNV